MLTRGQADRTGPAAGVRPATGNDRTRAKPCTATGSGESAPAELSIGELAVRSGYAPSALRFYDREVLIHARRGAGNQRRFDRSQLRRLAFIRAARTVGLTLEEVGGLLAQLPQDRSPTRADWTRISRAWRSRLDDEIEALVALRDGLEPASAAAACPCNAAGCPTRRTWPQWRDRGRCS